MKENQLKKKTYHKKIQKTQDTFICFESLKISLDNLLSLIEKNRVDEVKQRLSQLVSFYNSNSKIVDHLHKEQINSDNNIKSFSTTNNQKNKVVKIKNK